MNYGRTYSSSALAFKDADYASAVHIVRGHHRRVLTAAVIVLGLAAAIVLLAVAL